MGFNINEIRKITTKLHYKEIALIAVAMGEYQRLYKDTAKKEVLKEMEQLVNRLGSEMYNYPDDEKHRNNGKNCDKNYNLRGFDNDIKEVVVTKLDDNKERWSIYEESGQVIEFDFDTEEMAIQYSIDQSWKVVGNFNL